MPESVIQPKAPRQRGPNGAFLPREAAPAAETAAVEAMAVEATVAPTIDVTPAPAPAEPIQKASTMNEQITATAQTAFAQAGDKARETVEKTVKSFEEMNEFAKGNVEALVAAGKAATAGFETMAQGAAEFSKKNFEATTTAVKTMAAAKSPTEFFNAQNAFAKSQFDGLVAEMSKATETYLKVVGEVFAPLQNRAALAVDRFKTVAAVRA